MSEFHRRDDHAPVPHPYAYDAIVQGLRLVRFVQLGEFGFSGGGVHSLFHQEGSAILAPRHFSWNDIGAVALAAKKVRPDNQVHFVGKSELRSPVIKREVFGKERSVALPVFGDVLAGLGTVFIERNVSLESSVQRGAVTSIESIIAENGLIGLFPEGTRSKDGNQRKLKHGTSQLAHAHALPVYPIGVAGTYKPEGRRGVHVYIGAPIQPDVSAAQLASMDRKNALESVKEFTDLLTDKLLLAQTKADEALAARAA